MSSAHIDLEYDHRRMVRRLVKKTTVVSCQKGLMGMGPNLATRLYDISEDGLRLILRQPLSPGEEIEVNFTAAGTSKTVTVESTVVWCSKEEKEGYCVAAKFVSPLSYEAIFHII